MKIILLKLWMKEYILGKQNINGKYYDTIEMDILAEEFKGDYIKNKNIK